MQMKCFTREGGGLVGFSREGIPHVQGGTLEAKYIVCPQRREQLWHQQWPEEVR